MHRLLGSIVTPARHPFHLDPVGNPSIDNRGFLWSPEKIGLIIEIDEELSSDRDPWVTVMVDSKMGHCLFSEIKVL